MSSDAEKVGWMRSLAESGDLAAAMEALRPEQQVLYCAAVDREGGVYSDASIDEAIAALDRDEPIDSAITDQQEWLLSAGQRERWARAVRRAHMRLTRQWSDLWWAGVVAEAPPCGVWHYPDADPDLPPPGMRA